MLIESSFADQPINMSRLIRTLGDQLTVDSLTETIVDTLAKFPARELVESQNRDGVQSLILAPVIVNQSRSEILGYGKQARIAVKGYNDMDAIKQQIGTLLSGMIEQQAVMKTGAVLELVVGVSGVKLGTRINPAGMDSSGDNKQTPATSKPAP